MIHEEQEAPENHERWLISYADFITLLMVFFVVLYSMSKVDEGKYEALAQSLNAALSGGTGILDGGPQGVISLDDNGSAPKPKPEQAEGEGGEGKGQTELEQMEGIRKQLTAYFEEHGFEHSISTAIDERGLVVSLNDTILFDPGRAQLKSESVAELVAVGHALNEQDNYIRIEGHTDDRPISTGQFASNWELSAARATTVVRLMIDAAGIPPKKLSAVGYGEYKPVADNATLEGRAKNRRVDIILLSSVFNGLEA